MDDALRLRLYGTAEPVAAPRRFRAGRLSCDFEAGALSNLRWGTVEIARGIAYLLRDRDWGTVPAHVSHLVADESADAFTLDFDLLMPAPEGTLHAAARIEGHADGRLNFVVQATAQAEIQTNRCGFVVLHPADCAGRAVSVEHTDGSFGHGEFPREISPSQPLFDLRSLAYAPAEGLSLLCRLEAELPGDPAGKFEMEDQRNWSDASFKTYVGSLLDPWPYRLPAGRTLEQRVALTVRGDAAGSGRPAGAVRDLRFGRAGSQRMPAIGVGVPPGVHRASAAEHEALRRLGASWWIVDARLGDPALAGDLVSLALLRRGLDVRVQLDLIVSGDDSPDDAARRGAAMCAGAGLRIDAVRLLPEPYLKSYQPSGIWPDLPPLESYAQAARDRFAGALVGGGMFTYFTELNRKRPAAEGLDFIGHATCPIVHAADDESVMQTLEALPAIAASVHRLWPGLAYRLGPSTLAACRNPYGDAPAVNPDQRRLALAAVDPRHRGQFAAAWTLGYAAAVASGEVDVLALHHSHGGNGPFGDPAASAPVPAWRVWQALAAAAARPRVPIDGLGDGLAALAWQATDGASVAGLIANLGAEPVRLRLHGAAMTLGSYEVATLPSGPAA